MFGALQQVVGFYSQKLTVYEVNFLRVNGRCQYTQDTDRIIFGVPQNINTKESKIDYDGAISKGEMYLTTSYQLYFYDDRMQGEANKQTYLRYKNETWKVTGVEDWEEYNGGSYLYRLTKYVSIDDANI